LIPIIFHALTAVLTSLIAAYIQLPVGVDRNDVALWAVQLFCMCPIAFFCSQKFWIDNCAMMTATLCAFLHIVLATGYSASEVQLIARNLLSGILVGLLAVNTKISNAALLPFLAAWSVFTQRDTPNIKIRQIFIVCCSLLGGTLFGYSPWMLLYYVSFIYIKSQVPLISLIVIYSFFKKRATDRLLPNAWPSTKMIESSVFLQNAISKPWYYYISILFSITPIYFLGVILSAWSLIRKIKELFFRPLNSSPGQVLDNSLQHLIILLWPAGYIGGLTFIGLIGGGFQTRFLLPILPALAILTAVQLASSRNSSIQPSISTAAPVLVGIGAMHTMYYGVLFYPLFCDFDYSVFEIIENILMSPQFIPENEESLSTILKYIKHFGVNR
jgi:hypothetical protein